MANELRRDNFNIYNNDNITISIDPLYTRRSGVFFQTNALSAQRDQEVQDERSNNNDWNTIWRTRSQILDDGWSMEFADPVLSRCASARRVRRSGASISGAWCAGRTSTSLLRRFLRPRGHAAMYKFDIMATVVGVETPSVRKPIDFKPYAIASSTTNLLLRHAVSQRP